jgi:hypothetical protein
MMEKTERFKKNGSARLVTFLSGENLRAAAFSFTVGSAFWGTIACGEGLQVYSLPTENNLAAAVAVIRQVRQALPALKTFAAS